MSIAGSIDSPIEIIGGLVCDMAASELPLGVSPDCQDVQFTKSAAETRPGLTSVFLALTGNPTVNHIYTYKKLDETIRTMVWDSLGNLWQEAANGVLTSVAASLYAQSPWRNSTTLFNREYSAYGDGKIGQDAPRQYDATNLDRWTQGGPGALPTVADENTSANISSITQPAAVAITAASAVGFLATITAAGHGLVKGGSTTIAGVTPAGYNGFFQVQSVIDANNFTVIVGTSGLGPGTAFGTSASATSTVTTSAGHGLAVGQLVLIANASVAGYNTANPAAVQSVPSGTTFTYYAGAGGLAGAGAQGTAASAGSISAGLHGFSVAFQTRTGGIFVCKVTGSWTAAGGRRVVVSGIPIGPSNVVARILVFTTAGGAHYYYVAQGSSTLFSGVTVIADNVTTSVTVDFTDAILQGATQADYLFNQITVPEVMSIGDYSERLFAIGERNVLQNWQNMDFCGGFTGPALPNTPLGWTFDPTFGPGGGQASVQGDRIYWGDAYSIVGNGATATRGLITQSAVTDSLGVARIQAGVGYSVRVRVARNNALAQGTLHVHLFSASGGINTVGVQVTAAQATLAYQEFTAVLTAALGSIPSDLVLRIYADGTPTQNGDFVVGAVEIFPTATATNPSVVRVCRADQPESVDGTTGLMIVAQNDGRALRAQGKLRERYYFAKYGKDGGALYATADNAQEPNTWSVSQVSAKVGTPSARGMGLGEDWMVLADRGGLYITNGGEPQRIMQEIGHSASGLTLAWDQINWAAGHTLWVVVDTQEKRILVGAPLGAATTPNFILQLDYRDVEGGAEGIAGSPPIMIRYNGIKAVRDKSRKWSPWTISANAGAVVERFDGTQAVFLGCGSFGNQAPNGSPTGKIYKLDAGNRTDDGLAIPSYYLTAFTPQRETEQMLQLHAHRKLFYYLAMFCEGSGYVNLTAFPNGEANGQALPSLRLTSPATQDLETTINVFGERVAFEVASDATVAGNWFRLQKFTPSVNVDPWAPVRGQN